MLKKYAQETNQFQPAAPVTGMIASRRNVGATRRAIKAALAATLAGFFANAGAIAAPTAALDVAPVKSETELQNAFDALIAESKAAMMSDPALAVERATKAEAFVRALNDGVDADVQLATALWLKGEAQYRAGQSPVAMAAIDEALALVADADSLLYADLVLAQGRIASRNADVETAVKSYFEAHKRFAALKEARKESMTMQAIGSIYRDAESFGKAIEYYERAMETYPGDPRVDLSSFNNRGNIYKDMGQSNEARAYFEKALAIAEDMGSDVLAARILTNIAELEVAAGDYAEASVIADKAIARLQGEDGAHWARFAYGAKAHAQFKLGEVAEAERLIAKAFDDVDVESTSASFTDIHETAYQIHMMRANYAEALDHHQSYKRLSDEAKKVTSTANLALLAAQFDFAEKKLNIERLKNDRLQKDMLLEDARHRVEVQRAVLAVSGLVILFSFTMAVAFRNNRNRVAKVNETLEGTICELNAEVDRRVKVERDLVAAKDEAERASRIKSTFLATMSHELRTPLNGILGFTKILLGGKLEEEQREQIDIIDQSGEALLTLINDILDLSAIEAGKLNLQPTSINLRTTIEGAVRLLKAKAEEKNLALAVHVDPELPDHVIADGARLRQVLINLVGNAIKFTEKGSVAVVATRGETAGDVKFAVIDSGIGIPADKQHLLFDRFSQVDGSLNRKFGGTGLGLAICREIVEQMGGEIGVQSALGEGSEFYFNAPLGADDEIVPLPVNRARKLETTQRVVVVDDVAVIRKVYGMMLPALNASVEAASSGRDAIAKLIELNERGETVDVIIVNGELVDMAPQDFAQRVKRNALAEDAVFVLASPTKVADDDLSAMGFDRRIDQPISDKSVFAALTASSAPEAAPAPRAFEPSEGVSNVVSLVTAPVDARVLVVDDNETNRKLIAATLKSLRVAVDEAENGREAVAAAANADYSAILMDLQMPVMNGAEATRAIRGGCPRNAKTPIIAITAADSFDEMEEVSAAGMDDVMTKPVNPARLRAKIEECVAAAVVTEDAPTDEQRGGAVS